MSPRFRFRSPELLRHNRQLHRRYNEHGEIETYSEAEEAYLFLDQGFRHDALRDETKFRSCGCHESAAIGGKCRGCSRVSCAKCFLRCEECRSPLCLSCVDYLQLSTGREISLCPDCIGPALRWRYAEAILGVLTDG